MDIEARDDTGSSLVATLQRTSDDQYWQEASTAWGAGNTIANIEIALSELSSPFLGIYTGSNSGDVGSPGEVIVRVHDASDSYKVIGPPQMVVVEDNEVIDTAALARTAAENVAGFMPSSGPLLNAATSQTASEAAIDARLPSGATEIAGAGLRKQTWMTWTVHQLCPSPKCR